MPGLIYFRVPFVSMSVERTLIAVLLKKMAAINISSDSVDYSFHEAMSIHLLIHMSSDPMDFSSVEGGVHFVRRQLPMLDQVSTCHPIVSGLMVRVIMV